MKALEYSVAQGREFLARHDLLGHLRPEELDRLLASARVERVETGQVLFRKGDPGDKLFAVLAGRIMIGRRLERGKVDAVAITEAHLLVIEHGDLKLSQEDLGRMTGVSRESINKQLRNWQHDGLIAIDDGAIVIRDPDQLRRIIETP